MQITKIAKGFATVSNCATTMRNLTGPIRWHVARLYNETGRCRVDDEVCIIIVWLNGFGIITVQLPPRDVSTE